MFKVVIGGELWDEKNERFLSFEEVTLEMEHSLVSLSKWESTFEKPLLGPQANNREETMGYLKCMVIGDPPKDDRIWLTLGQDVLAEINEYIGGAHTATTFGDLPGTRTSGSREVITSEVIYYWLATFRIPFVVERWHLNRLFALIRVCNVKNSKPSKASKSATAVRNRELNAQRRKEMGTSG